MPAHAPSRPLERTAAVLCYLGAMRAPVVALIVPGWAFTVPSGLLIAAATWWYGRRRGSPYLVHHGREGFRWAIQANLLLAGLAVGSKGLYYVWLYSGLVPANAAWHFSATLFQWGGVLISILTGWVMWKTARGDMADALTVPRTS